MVEWLQASPADKDAATLSPSESLAPAMLGPVLERLPDARGRRNGEWPAYRKDSFGLGSEAGTPSGVHVIARAAMVAEQAPANQPPVAVSAEPPEGGGPRLDLRAQFQDPDGPSEIVRAALRIGESESGVPACMIEYD
ncbi:MAG: hypothetical protein N2036_16180, partial [Bryobacteraceae bacterium]|nr:hypothetical protein [Bryobacteraceae bacterium]